MLDIDDATIKLLRLKLAGRAVLAKAIIAADPLGRQMGTQEWS
jgi:hypothetical protein